MNIKLTKMRPIFFLVSCITVFSTAQAAIITVNTTNNVSPLPGQTSLKQAIASLHDGDTIRFAIPGPGPHYIATPTDGYALITNNNVTIDGYSQSNAVPNTNPILAPNNAQLKIVLDSRNGGFKLMDFAKDQPTDDNGFEGLMEGAILPVLNGTNFHVQGICFLGTPKVGTGVDISLYFVAFAKYASGGHVSGCWLGVSPDGTSVGGSRSGIAAFRYRQSDGVNFTNDILVNDLVVGVKAGATNARSQFNVIVASGIPVIIEGDRARISGNFLMVMPDGLHDYNVAFDPAFAGLFEGAIELGRAGNNTLIGTDGDGVNDADERNVIGGTVPESMGGYPHNIEFYGVTGTNIVIAGNYIGVGINGVTQFTNGVPAFNGKTDVTNYNQGIIRMGSDFDGVSDALEANVIYNNYPPELFPPSDFPGASGVNFFDELNANATTTISLRGNVLVNNFPAPVSPAQSDILVAYYAKAQVNPFNGVVPTISTNTTRNVLIGTVPIANADFPTTMVDLYIADPMGITNGQAAMYSELPYGFVQGKTYLGSFVCGSGSDLDPSPGGFEFDISDLNIPGPAPATLTITATYSRDPAGRHNARMLTSPFSDPLTLPLSITSISRMGSDLNIGWYGGKPPYQVQARTNAASGTWGNVGGPTSATSAMVPITGNRGFYRVQSQ